MNKNLGTKHREVSHLHLGHSLAMWPWSHNWNSQTFCFLSRKMGTTATLNSLYYSENCLKECMGKHFILQNKIITFFSWCPHFMLWTWRYLNIHPPPTCMVIALAFTHHLFLFAQILCILPPLQTCHEKYCDYSATGATIQHDSH